MPESWSEYLKRNNSKALEIQSRDPELVLLLSGQAPAALKIQALDGSLSPFAPTLKEKEEASKQAEVQALYNRNPWVSGSVTDQMRLLMLDEKVAERCKKEAETMKPPVSDETARMEASQRRTRIASLNQMSGRFD